MGELNSPADYMREFVVKGRTVPDHVMRDLGLDREVLASAVDSLWWANGPHIRGFDALSTYYKGQDRADLAQALEVQYETPPGADAFLGGPQWLCLLDGKISARRYLEYGDADDKTVERLGLPARTHRRSYDDAEWVISSRGTVRVFIGRQSEWLVVSNYGRSQVSWSRDIDDTLDHYASLLPSAFHVIAPSERYPNGRIYSEPTSVAMYLTRRLHAAFAGSLDEKRRIVEKEDTALDGLNRLLKPYEKPRD